MRIIAKKVLRDFWKQRADSQQQLKAWFQESSRAHWKNQKQLKQEFPTTRFIGGNRVIFNIKGNKYRLIVKINYEYQIIWIRFIGTHAEYDKIDATKI